MPTKANTPKMATPKIKFRVAIRHNCQIAGCELPIASSPGRAKDCSPGLLCRLANARDQSSGQFLAQSLEILGYGRNLNVLALESRAPNDFHGIFGNLLSHVDTKGDDYQIGVLQLHSRPLVPHSQ